MEDNSINTYAIGKRIEQQRLKQRLSQTDLALKMGYRSSSTIRKWEIGENIPSGVKLIKLVRTLGTTTDYILLGIDNSVTYNTQIDGDNSGIASMSGNINGNVNFSSEQSAESSCREQEIASNSASDLDIQKELLKHIDLQTDILKSINNNLNKIVNNKKENNHENF